MFVLVKISDIVQIHPADFTKISSHAIQDNIHKKYAHKVIQNIGLCICLWDLIRASEGLISQSAGTGSVNVNVEFRLIVFRPFKGEIIQANIIDFDENGIRLSTDFFIDIWVPKESLFEGAVYEERTGSFVWIWKTEDGKEFFYDRNEAVRFRVEEEVWNDHAPNRPPGEEEEEETETVSDVVKLEAGSADDTDSGGKKSKVKDVPYTIIGSMSSDGLGPLFWWREDFDPDEDMEYLQ